MTKTPGPKNSNSKLVVNHHVKAAADTAAAPRRENTFSKSRDMREDRSQRQMKTTRVSPPFPRGQASGRGR